MISWSVARQWVTGNRLSCAIRAAKQLNKVHITALINFLGENIRNRGDAQKIFNEYARAVKEIKSRRLDADISIKPTQFCLHPHSHYCSTLLAKLMGIAKKERVFVWFDMERSVHVQDTIDLYLALLKNYKNTGICIQACLKRSGKDLRKIIKRGGIVRLVKGVYVESPKVAYTKKKDIDDNFLRLMKILFAKSRRFAIGTHDERIISEALAAGKKYSRNVDFQMMYGVKRGLAKELSKNHKVGIYVPYGRAWGNYVRRRLRERNRWKK